MLANLVDWRRDDTDASAACNAELKIFISPGRIWRLFIGGNHETVASGCELALIHELHPDWADYASRTQAGWARMLGTLAGVLQPPPAK